MNFTSRCITTAVMAVSASLSAVADKPFRTHPAADSSPVMRAALPAPRTVNPIMRPAVNMMQVFGSKPMTAGQTTKGEIDLRGFAGYNTTAQGFYRVPSSSDGSLELLAPLQIDRPRGAVMTPDAYYLSQVWDEGILGGEIFSVCEIDPESFKIINKHIVDFSLMATDIARDPITGKIYGCFYEGYEIANGEPTGWTFGSVDYSTMTVTPIKSLKKYPYMAMAFDADGTLYAIDGYSNFVTVNTTTGDKTQIGRTGVTFYDGTVIENISAAIDPVSGRFFATWANFYNGALYEIDKTTGKASKLVDFPNGEQIFGLYIPEPEALPAAPAAVSDLTLDTDGGNLDLTLTFTLPVETFAGDSLDGTIDWKVECDKNTVGSGSGNPGSNVSVPVSVSEAREYVFTVIAGNQAGWSPKAHLQAYIGHDVPEAPVVDLERHDNAFVISWRPVTSGIHGGYVDAANVTYTVTRMTDNKVVAQNITATTYTDEVAVSDNLVPYSYSVTATATGLTSEPGISGKMALGEIHPPYTADFNDPDALAFFTILDNNGDGRTWHLSGGRLTLSTSVESIANDWAITPPVWLEAGKRYRVTFAVWSYSDRTPETFEVKWGAAPTAEGMTETLLDVTEIDCKEDNPYRIEEYILPEHDGIYYIGFHGLSNPGTMFLFINDLEIAAGMKDNAPDAVTSLKAMPDPNGDMKATISFNLPETDVDGRPVSTLSTVDIYCNRKLVKTLDAAAPGQPMSYTHPVDGEKGVYTFRVVPHSAEGGVGMPADVALYVGINLPGKVGEISTVETDGDGEVMISWSAPETDVDGYYISPAIVTYDLYDITFPDEPLVVAQNLTETSYTYRYLNPGSRQMLGQWMVISRTEAGEGDGRASGFLATGTPYPTPYHETFPAGMVNNIASTYPVYGTALWDIYTDERGIRSQDNDNGYACFPGGYQGYSGALISGKINIPENSPGMTFYTYNIEAGGENLNTLALEVDAGNGWEQVTEVTMRDLPVKNGWSRVTVSLAEYAGKTVVTRFIATTRTYAITLLDNITIETLPATNLAAPAITAPAEVAAQEEFDVTVWIENNGMTPCDFYSVQLYRDDERIGAEVIDVPLAPGARKTVKFTDVLSPVSSEKVVYTALVATDDDADPDDDMSPETTVVLAENIYPVVTDLTAGGDGEAISLAWSAPDCASFIHPVTEDFENATPYAINDVEGWTFIDADKGATYGFNGMEFPNQKLPMAYIVFEDAIRPGDDWFAAHSGHQFIASMAAVLSPTVDNNDDWIISPILSGKSQKVTFYAKSFDVSLGYEIFEVYWSTGGTRTIDFKKISGNYPVEAPQEWTRFSYILPEGAKRFAIRCVSPDYHALFLDDITYTPEEAPFDVTVEGYNIFRDGVKINDRPVTGNSFVDNVTDDETHSYAITTIYNVGESGASNIVTLSRSGIADIVGNNVTVTTANHAIVVSGAEGTTVNIYTPDGRTVTSVTATGNTVIPVNPGIYIVTVGNTVTKVAVK